MRRASLVVLALLLVGCNNPYGACSRAGVDIGASLNAGFTTVNDLHKAGLLSLQETSNALDYMEYANKADAAFLICSKTAHSNGNKIGTYTACAQVFFNALGDPQKNTLINVMNPAAQERIRIIMNGVIQGLNLLTTSLGGA